MNYSNSSKPGMSDPYWYEWSIGEKYLIYMINPDNNIKSVCFQKNISLGLDDVVVTYSDDSIKCIQVKHTRANDTLTFGNLIYSENGKKSLLKEIADSWYEEKDKYTKVIPIIFTNRKSGGEGTCLNKETNEKYKRPALNDFLEDLQKQLGKVKSLEEIDFKDYSEAWNEWIRALEGIRGEDKLTFLKLLKIETSQPEFDEIGQELINDLMAAFGINEKQAESLLSKLDHAMRKWTSSLRNKEELNVEDVYQALSVEEISLNYNHDLLPQEPFFKSRLELINTLEEELVNGSKPIVFVKGIPGIGKTNIISKLSSKRDSIIKIRYYAYEPIQPDKEYLPVDVSDRVKKEVFWDELLSQLRRCLKGKLSKYKVPLQNDFLTLEQKKDVVINIASRYASDENIKFIIAIDGIDHAARAFDIKETFLNSLPDPEYLPYNIRFIILGQPEEGYENYPRWLYGDNEYVKKYEVDGITKEDIQELIENKIPNERELEYKVLTDLIEKYTNGNTLAAIFAVYEAIKENNIEHLEKKLIHRKLSGNITEYYNSIWENAIDKIKNQYSFMEYRLAGIFALINERVNADILMKVFKEINIPRTEWDNILYSLQPLLIEENNKYRLLHNDVRVFLSNKINKNYSRVSEVSSLLAEYYIKYDSKSKNYYSDIIKLLRMAKREKEIIGIFNPEFIIGAYVNSTNLFNLKIMAYDILQDEMNSENINYGNIQLLVCSMETINQLENSNYDIEECNFREKCSNLSICKEECYVDNITDWTSSIILNVLEKIDVLLGYNFIERSRNMFNRWFGGLSVKDIWGIIGNELVDNRINNTIRLTNKGNKIANLLGKHISRFKMHNMFKQECEDKKNLYDVFYSIVNDSFYKTSIILYKNQELRYSLQYVNCIYYETLYESVYLLIKNRQFRELRIMNESLQTLLHKNDIGHLISIFINIITHNYEGIGKLERNKIKEIVITESDYEYEILIYIMYALVMGYIDIGKDSNVVASDVLNKYLNKHKYKSNLYYGVLFNLMSFIGRWLYCKKKNITINITILKELFEKLFLKHWKPDEYDLTSEKIYSSIIIAIIDLAEDDKNTKQVVEKLCDQVFCDFPVNQFMEAGWYFYKNNNIDYLKKWYSKWLGENGEGWSENLYERNSIAKRIFDEIDKYKLEKYFDIEKTKSKLQWSVIGYASHKEYSLGKLIPWYKKVLECDYDKSQIYIQQIKKISDIACKLGDNREAIQIDYMYYGDCFKRGIDGVNSLMSIPRICESIIKEPTNLVNGLIGMLETNKLNKDELLKLWAFGIGILDWRIDINKSYLASLKNAIIRNSNRNNILGIEDELKKMGSIEFGCIEDSIRYRLPDRWCDHRIVEKINAENPNEYIEKIINEEIEATDFREIIMNLKLLKKIDDNEQYQAILMKLYEVISKKSDAWYNNELIEYIISECDYNEQLIRQHIDTLMKNEKSYKLWQLKEDLGSICVWKIKDLGYDYSEKGLDEYIKMHNAWITQSGNILLKVDEYDHVSESMKKTIDFFIKDKIKTFDKFYEKYLIMNLLGNDADRAEASLRGIWRLINISPRVIGEIFNYWNIMHYRAKEWFLCVVELAMDNSICELDIIKKILIKAQTDCNFNVMLYASILLKRCAMDKDEFLNNLSIVKQKYFNLIPDKGYKKMLKYSSNTRCIGGTQIIFHILEWLDKATFWGSSGIEERLEIYKKNRLNSEFNLFNTTNSNTQFKVALYYEQLALFEILYKDFSEGRWQNDFVVLAQRILSSTEPFILLTSPKRFKYRKGRFLNGSLKEFRKLDKYDQKKYVYTLLREGIDNENEILLGGAVTEYDRQNELFMFFTSYVSDNKLNAKSFCEGHINGRILLLNDEEFFEDYTRNIILLNGGVSSFCNDQLLCSVSKYAMNLFGWKVVVNNEIHICNSEGENIGRFEWFIGAKDIESSEVNANQPQMQRIIITKEEYNRINNLIKDNVINSKIDIFINSER